MLPYWLLFGWLAVAAVLYGKPRADRSSVALLFAAVVIAAMIGLRYKVGGDWSLYKEMFEYIGRLDLVDALQYPTSDPAYSLLNWIAVQIGAGVWLVNLVCGGILLWGVMTIAVRQPNPWLVLVVAVPYLIIVVGMGYTRQATAIGLSLVAISAFLNGSFRTFILAMIAATLFHKSAIITLPIIGLTISRNRLMTVTFLGVVALLLYYFLVSSRFENLSRNYLGAQLESEGASVRIAMTAVPAVLFLLFQRRFGFDELERKVWRNFSLGAMASVGALVVFSSSTAVDRLALYFMVIQLVVLGRVPWALGRASGAQTPLILLIIAYSATIELVWLNFAKHAALWVPYRIYPIAW
jgi:hypothetical protein